MRALEPQTRFLLRGSALLIVMLTVWWLVLLGPMLYLLKGAASMFVDIQGNPAGGWTIRVPLEEFVPAAPGRPLPKHIQSIDFDMQRSDAITFTFSLPVFWAIMLAAPGARRNLRSFLLGTALMSGVEVALFLAFAQITARGAVAQLIAGGQPEGKQAHHLGEYLVVNVLPYTIPFVVALMFDRPLREEILPAVETSGSRSSRRRIKTNA